MTPFLDYGLHNIFILRNKIYQITFKDKLYLNSYIRCSLNVKYCIILYLFIVYSMTLPTQKRTKDEYDATQTCNLV